MVPEKSDGDVATIRPPATTKGWRARKGVGAGRYRKRTWTTTRRRMVFEWWMGGAMPRSR
eukprot:CAMPEP_0206487098 /NCGR_PEP_ID=MMETSP0324_2-20121206/41417_1 /ASSEMBLY_ACC=CAM_ASM_000836 /TAXON_ID=2866 /ORGANISM="Crypthecodinium cohnii, Strain Seligo" /LENGTH=59 /DNA_ID=CAMNT_0053965471 /DNA_START=1337 /DNA_END=1516 /DNA_ORIENTATION=-